MKFTKEISEVTKVVIFVSMGYYSYIALMSRGERTKWDPGQLRMCTTFNRYEIPNWGNPITNDKEMINQLETDVGAKL
jgi:hypothetical protein